MKKDYIIAAALTEFSNNSYDNASVNTIIKESETSKGTFYHYFKTKEDLYVSLAELVLQEKIDFFKKAESQKGGTTLQAKSIFELLRLQL